MLGHLYFVLAPKKKSQVSIYYPHRHNPDVPVLLLHEEYGIASVLAPDGVFTVEAEYLSPCQTTEHP